MDASGSGLRWADAVFIGLRNKSVGDGVGWGVLTTSVVERFLLPQEEKGRWGIASWREVLVIGGIATAPFLRPR